jgi:hypothetical protein
LIFVILGGKNQKFKGFCGTKYGFCHQNHAWFVGSRTMSFRFGKRLFPVESAVMRKQLTIKEPRCQSLFGRNLAIQSGESKI